MSGISEEQLWQLAVTTLADNWWHDHTVPSRTLYPYQWSWDTGFIAVGLAHVAPARAWHDLRTLFEAQWADGRVPHIVFDAAAMTDPKPGRERYFPGPAFWRSTDVPAAPQRPTSGLVQPPVHALAAWDIYRHSPDSESRERAAAELGWLYPRLVAQQRYLTTHRDIGGSGLACLVHPWESGQDNSPAWDAALAAVPADLTLLEKYQRRDLEVSHRSHRPTDADYARYILIAQRYRDHGYLDDGPGERYPFLVECPGFNSLIIAAELALAEIAPVVGADPQPHRERADRLTDVLVDRLFDPATGMFHARDVYIDQLSPVRYLGGLLPLLLPDLPTAQVKSLLVEAAAPAFGLNEHVSLPLPSYDRTAPDLDPERYWRGPIWINMNWLLWRGLRQHGQPTLATALRGAMIDVVRRSGCYEYFHTTTGAGIGTPEFSWTAALTLDLLAHPEG
ncbi:hypothetical protein JQS43_11900 [Natronosporangium hydrolyticum]|uniref:Mannosylglycerate hydrolase MGH1-like glycoside hydrolase domain-containing protein n=1 Tax=Natronosporangium hydrolyticum TaxID=2811111 RepID=A0A895YLR2_9ACTN|nr:hypothetical protein [Natronosporangium hydrolyticum]QSB16912.1 hypothetical protein JQS43_11900 [Natronosporangium hydrolyticum]